MPNRDAYLRRVYGITQNQYDDLLKNQGGGCAICGKTAKEEKRSLAVDHDHKTGEIRGIVCNYCNRRLVGRHRDADLLRRLAAYVERHTGWIVPKKKKRKRRRRRKEKVSRR